MEAKSVDGLISVLHQKHSAWVQTQTQPNTKVFEYFRDAVTWRQAWRNCRSKGGKLATIRSAEENAQVDSSRMGAPAVLLLDSVWLGGRRRWWGWKWASCGWQTGYTNWDPNSNLDEYANRCLYMGPNVGSWFAGNCQEKKHYVCQFYKSSTPEPLPTATFTPTTDMPIPTPLPTPLPTATDMPSPLPNDGMEFLGTGNYQYCTTENNTFSALAFNTCAMVEMGAIGTYNNSTVGEEESIGGLVGQELWFPEYIFPSIAENYAGRTSPTAWLIYVNHQGEPSVYRSSPAADAQEHILQGASCWQPDLQWVNWMRVDLKRCIDVVMEKGLTACDEQKTSFEGCDVLTTRDLSSLPISALDASQLQDGKRIYMPKQQRTRSPNILTTDELDGCWIVSSSHWEAVGAGRCLRGQKWSWQSYNNIFGSPPPTSTIGSSATDDDRRLSKSPVLIALAVGVAVLFLITVILAAVACMLKLKLRKAERNAVLMRSASLPYGTPIEPSLQTTTNEQDLVKKKHVEDVYSGVEMNQN